MEAFTPEETQECPVCYESLSGNERTLSCSHVFCHDCLVKTLVSFNADGSIGDTITCPVCRHQTFIKKQKEALVSLRESKAPEPEERQTLEVPLHPAPGARRGARRASRDGDLDGLQRLLHHCTRVLQRVRQKRLINPSQNACQIFIISAQGRPMTEDVVMTVVHPQRRTPTICTTARCLFLLLTAFTLLALVAVTMPWILLA